MSWQQIASGGVLDLPSLSAYEDQIPEGARGKLELDLRLPVSQGVAQDLENALANAGVTEVHVSTASPMLRITWRKGFPWLAVILSIILGSVIIMAVVTGWRIFKEVVPEGAQFPVALILLSIGLLAAIALVRR